MNTHDTALWDDWKQQARARDSTAALLDLLHQEMLALAEQPHVFARCRADWEEVRRAIAQNPNTNPSLLQTLFTDDGIEPLYERVLKNPAFPLILIECPDFFHGVNPRLLLRLLCRAGVPEVMWTWLQQYGHPHPTVQEAILDYAKQSPPL
jgi:hypothetical protein